MEDFRTRMSLLMKELGKTQADVCRETGMQTGLLSMYMSGKRSPKQDKITIIAQTYNVSETWLMGLDVQKDRIEYNYDEARLLAKLSNDKTFLKIAALYMELPQDKRREVAYYMEFMKMKSDKE